MDPRLARTLADLVTAAPGTGRIFARHGIDYACGGSTTLAAAAEAAGVEPAALLGEIDTAGAGGPIPRFDALPDDELIVHILVRYHDPLEAEMRRLLALVRGARSDAGLDPELPHRLETLLANLAAELEEHLAKEEQMIFPLLRGGYADLARTPVRILSREHDDIAAVLRSLRELLHSVPERAPAPWPEVREGLRALASDLQEHMHLENNILFQRVLAR